MRLESPIHFWTGSADLTGGRTRYLWGGVSTSGTHSSFGRFEELGGESRQSGPKVVSGTKKTEGDPGDSDDGPTNKEFDRGLDGRGGILLPSNQFTSRKTSVTRPRIRRASYTHIKSFHLPY